MDWKGVKRLARAAMLRGSTPRHATNINHLTITIMKTRVYKELTNDKGIARNYHARDNWATYIITSASGHDEVELYKERYGKQPTANWFNRHFIFERV